MLRRDIADYLGLTFETVSRSLSALRDEGILSFTRSTHREIVLHDRPKLAARAAVSLTPSAASDVRLRAKADHQRIRNRVRGIGRSDHGDVNEIACPN